MRRAAVLALALGAATGLLRAGESEPPEALDETVRRVIARVAPGVVRIEVDGARAKLQPERRFFRDAAAEPREGGAGIVLRRDGLILTHASLVAWEVPRIEVLTANGRRLGADLVARDPELDVALLKVDPGSEPLVPLELGTATGLEPGRLVLTLGNPFGVARDSRPSSSLGVVSFVGPIDAREVRYAGPVIATDAAVNPGNEGGPLVDLDGRVLGVVSTLARDRRSSALVGFAIPIDAIAPRLEALARGGAPPRLGILLAREGLKVERVVPESPADKAGVLEGDLLRAVDGQELASREDLRKAVERKRPGSRVVLSLERAGKTVRVEARLEEGDR